MQAWRGGKTNRGTLVLGGFLGEILEIVDENNNVIGTETRKKIHEVMLMHRAVHILVVNSKEEILLQQRSEKKDTYPGYYTTSACGHLDVGEDYLTAAKRELQEELGFEGELKKALSVAGQETTNKEFVETFLFKTDEEPVFPKEEISKIKYFPIKDLEELIASDSIKLTPMAKLILKRFLEVQK